MSSIYWLTSWFCSIAEVYFASFTAMLYSEKLMIHTGGLLLQGFVMGNLF